jgi:YidC/Oxa1 family membrane protein insertase
MWTDWLTMLGRWLEILSVDGGLGAGIGIVALTLLLRFALLPISWWCAYHACVQQKRMQRLRPALDEIRQRHGHDRKLFAEKTLAVYRNNNAAMFDWRPLVGALVQAPVMLGMFQLLRDGARAVRFLWIASLSRPDLWIAIAAAATTALMISANPELPDAAKTLMIWLPSLIAFVFALKFASALGLYWVVSNCFTAVQTCAVHRYIAYRTRAGSLHI